MRPTIDVHTKSIEPGILPYLMSVEENGWADSAYGKAIYLSYVTSQIAYCVKPVI